MLGVDMLSKLRRITDKYITIATLNLVRKIPLDPKGVGRGVF